MPARPTLAVVLGIRPDVIRMSLVLGALRAAPEVEAKFIWSGQHYSDNLKDVFFRELGVAAPDVELDVAGDTDAAVSAGVIARLYPVLAELRPRAAVFLGDTNTVMGCLAAAQLDVPIVHVEGCMRSYDWRMPEEKYRTTIDHLSDVIYAYFDEYKAQGIAEGLGPDRIVVTGNLIVDVLDAHYFAKRDLYDAIATDAFFRQRGLARGEYYLMTCHRRENVHVPASLEAILALVGATPRRVYFPASYRTQRVLRESRRDVPANVTIVDPVGYREMLALLVNARGVITDSGTVVEEACVLQVPSVQMRTSTERPQVYDARSSVKFDPADPRRTPAPEALRKLDALHGGAWEHGLGDGRASSRVVADLVARAEGDGFRRHRPVDYPFDVSRSYRGDGL
jgi:UDP-N-acetylglucosamine 2-epimerase (non-hydrolysing)